MGPARRGTSAEVIMTNRLMRSLSVLLLGLCLAISAGSLLAQEKGTLQGTIVDANERLPLPTVKVTIMGARRSTETDSEGAFLTYFTVPVRDGRVESIDLREIESAMKLDVFLKMLRAMME